MRQPLTYRELEGRADQLARRLRSLGVGPEVRVGVMLARSVEMVVALLGVLKAGGAYVALDPAYPRERLRFMLEDAQAAVLVTQAELRDLAAGTAAQLLCLDTDWQEEPATPAAAESGRPLLAPRSVPLSAPLSASPVLAENLAYVIYTSGSTGTPKGVAITHRSGVALLWWAQHYFSPESLSVVLASTSLCFDLSVFELFVPLCTGGRCVVVRDALELGQLGEAAGVRLVNTVPSAMSELVRTGSIPPTVEVVNLAGEALTAQLAAGVYAAGSGVRRVVNLYGPSEDTTYSTWCEVGREEAEAGRPPAIGRPLWNTRAYVLDARMQLVAEGVRGELYLGGEGLARGYLGRAELTAERFVPDPFGGEAGARLYRTGDVVRWREGELEYLGRADGQVKVRGFRIELGEVEAVLSKHEAVREACVVATRGWSRWQAVGGLRGRGGRGQEAECRGVAQLTCKQRLPEYMVPSVFVTLDELPLTPNGKVDRRALPEPGHERPELEGGYVAPRTAVEEALAGIWSEVLGVEEVGIYDNFFELGGDSILSIQIVSKAGHAGLDFAPRQLFQHQTIAELALAVNLSTAVEAEQSPVVGPVELTPVQRRFFEDDDPDPHHFNQALMLEMRDTADPDLLRRAFEHLHLHHDALRLRFEREGAVWRQFGEAPRAWDGFLHADLSGLQDVAQAATVAETTASVQGSLNLSAGPLLKAVLFELGAGRAPRLLIVAHHLLMDSVSWRILLDDLDKAYAQLGRGEEVSLGPKTNSFRQWAERLKEYAESDSLKPDYWLDALGRRVSPLPADFRGDNRAAAAQSVSIELEAEETQVLLREVPSAYRAHVDEVLLAAVAQGFRDWTGQPLLIDIEAHGREGLLVGLNLTRTVGWLTSVYPVLFDVGEDAAPGDVLKSVKEQLRRVPQHGIGYGLMRYMGGEEIAAGLRALPQAEASFNYEGEFDRELTEAPLFGLEKEFLGRSESPRRMRRYLIEINARVFEGRLQMIWTYSRSVHSRATVGRLADSAVETLRELIARCRSGEAGGVTPSDFPFARLDEDELGKLAALIDSEDESDLLTA